MEKIYTKLTLNTFLPACFLLGALLLSTSAGAQCSDPSACNYGDPFNFCTYPGCQDPTASNYDPNAGCAGVCFYNVYGCTDPNACNYNSNANIDNGSCTYPICSTQGACNYGDCTMG